MSRLRVWVALALALMATPGQARACMSEGVDAHGGIYRPLALSIDGVPSGVMVGVVSGGLPMRTSGFLRLGIRQSGDRWEIGESGDTDRLSWRAQQIDGANVEAAAVKIWLWGKAEGRVEIPLRYLPAKGRPAPGIVVITVGPPPPPPAPATLTVEGEELGAWFDSYRPLLIRLKPPLAPDHRWEVKEAATSDQTGGDDWRTLAVEPVADDGALFRIVAPGQRLRIVFAQRRDGWQLFADTVTVSLTAYPIPKC